MLWKIFDVDKDSLKDCSRQSQSNTRMEQEFDGMSLQRHRRGIDMFSMDPSKIADPRLRAAIEKAQKDRAEGKPFQRPVFNPHLYHKERREVSTVTTSAVQDTVPVPYKYLVAPSEVLTADVVTSVIVGLQLVTGMPRGIATQVDIMEPTDVDMFRLPSMVSDELHQELVKHTLQCHSVYTKLKQQTEDVYTLLSVLPMTLSVRVKLTGSKADLAGWMKQVQQASVLQTELLGVVEQIKPAFNSDTVAPSS